MTVEELQEDVRFLAERSLAAGCFGWCELRHAQRQMARDVGESANSLVGIAYGVMDAGDQRMPRDSQDLAACEQALLKMPKHRREMERVREAFALASAAVMG